MKISSQQLIQDLQFVSTLISKPPTKFEYLKHGKYGVNTIVRRFGFWNNALINAIGETNLILQGIINIECSHCHAPLTIHKSAEKTNNFCSQSCAAKFNNKKTPKRKLNKKCKSCENLIKSHYTYCPNCISLNKHLRGGQLLSEKKIIDVIYKKGTNKFGVIRGHARTITKNRKYCCQKCNYSFHVDTCHIKEIHDFTLDTKLSVVNHPDNLLLLCRNCHWEMDHGLWKWSGGLGSNQYVSSL